MSSSGSDYLKFLQNRIVEECSYLTSVSTDIRDHVAEMVEVRTGGAWRQNRMMRVPLAFRLHPERRWLTVGDTGRDGMILIHNGMRNVVPSSLNGVVLAQLQAAGLIERFGVENAERMSWDDGGFDYVLCKQSLHHMQRPFVAIYEMLRVSRRAVVLIEPQDRRQPEQSVIPAAYYEPSGNYVHSISQGELAKLAIGANLPAIGFFEFNEAYTEDSEHAPATADSPAFRAMLAQLATRDDQAVRGERGYDRLTAVLFHEVPEPDLARALRDCGLIIHELPGNPYAPDARRRLPWCLFEEPIARLSAEGGYFWGIGEDFGYLWLIYPEIEPLIRTGKAKLVDRSGRSNLSRILDYLPAGKRPASDILNYEIHDPAAMNEGLAPIVLTSQIEKTRRSMSAAAIGMGVLPDRIIDIGYAGPARVD
jgi:hypothetical protein